MDVYFATAWRRGAAIPKVTFRSPSKERAVYGLLRILGLERITEYYLAMMERNRLLLNTAAYGVDFAMVDLCEMPGETGKEDISTNLIIT